MKNSPRHLVAPRRGPEQRRPTDRYPNHFRRASLFHYLDEAPDEAPQNPYARDPAMARVEAALLLADEPLTAKKLANAAGLADAAEARRVLERLIACYDADGTAFQIEEIAGGFQLLSRPVYHAWLIRLRRTGGALRLSPAAMETLAVVSYRQPIVRAEIENIRGVQCGDILNQLMEKGLIKIAGRHDSLGRPVLYGTTKRFLQEFGLNSLRNLPEVEQLKRPQDATEGT